jgi:hypothetical protein
MIPYTIWLLLYAATEQAQLQAETRKQDALLEQIHVGILGIRAQAEVGSGVHTRGRAPPDCDLQGAQQAVQLLA